jgi:hypothetical protein
MTVLEQCVHFALAKELPNSAFILLGFDKRVDLVQGPITGS